MIDLNALKTFITIAEHGSFSEAGRRLGLSQPAVSQAMEGLQKHFGVQLFERAGRSVRLTEAGQTLRPIARELLAGALRLEETMASLQGEVVGEMTIGCSTASGKYLLPGLIARFRRGYPQVRINVHVTSRESVINRVLSGEYPLGVSSRRIEHHDLEWRPFFTDEVILIAAASHPWASNRYIYPDDLLDEPMILREEGAGTREVMMDSLQQRDISPDMLNIAMELGNAEAIVMAVEEAIGVAFISRLSAERSLALSKVVEVKVEGMQLVRQISLLRNRRFPATRAQLGFWEFVTTPQSELPHRLPLLEEAVK